MTTPTIAKQWVKNKDKKGMHMEWTVQCNKLVIELLANRVPLFHRHDIVRELPCVKNIQYMRSTLLRTTKSLAAYWLGSADSWKQLIT
jgi:hypothetical protein